MIADWRMRSAACGAVARHVRARVAATTARIAWSVVLAFACISLRESSAAPAAETQSTDVLVVVGAPGATEFNEGFRAAADAWRHACAQAGAACAVVGLEAEAPAADSDRAQIRSWLATVPAAGSRPAWLVYVGHGTFDGRDARLNLRGPDVTANELRDWLAPFTRPLVIVHGGSASGPLIPLLAKPGRVVITATDTGEEVNYARFGERFAQMVAAPAADIDQDGQTSVLEAFLSAAQQVQVFYAEAARMPTEHALIDDNGDGRGTPPDWFHGVRAVKRAEEIAQVDGTAAQKIALLETAAERALTAEQRVARERLEAELEKLRARKASLPEDEYLRQLEIVLRQLSQIYATPVREAEDS